jgi:hypothetical protein
MSKKEEIKYEYIPSTKEYLSALSQFSAYIKIIDASQKAYQPLHAWLKENEKKLLGDGFKLPTIGELSKQTGVPSAKIPKYLKSLYDDIHESNLREPNKFISNGQKHCHCSFEYRKQLASFNLGFDVIPREREVLNFYFLKPMCGWTYFYVKNIYHEIENGKQITSISFTAREPNAYLNLLKEKAYLHHWISFNEYFDETDFSLQEKLVKMYREL